MFFKGTDIIDLGAGTGRLTCLVAPDVRSIKAFDISDHMLHVAAEKLRNAGFCHWEPIVADHRSLQARGQTPISMCFTVNVIEYDGCKILFGNFNDSTWLIEPDKKKPVDIQNTLVRFKNGEVHSDKVEKGYIVYSKSLADVEVVKLYDNNGILQSDLNDLRRYGSVFNEASFVDIVQ